MIRSVELSETKVRFLDQRQLPGEEVYVDTDDYQIVAEGIRTLRIRGAPAIGVAAAFATVLAARQLGDKSVPDRGKGMAEALSVLAGTRPTAVNLFAALARMENILREAGMSDWQHAVRQLEREAGDICSEEIEASRNIGLFGASLLPSHARVLTHCNTGSLATVGSGTALSVITTAARDKGIARVYVDETRPLLQGARLTMWELKKESIESILITDSTAGFVMRETQIDAVIVGADRIAANGDVANKIGTYTLAVLAEKHGVPFYVAAPTSTLDLHTRSGKEIKIEERGAEELTHIAGVRIAPDNIRVFAPAFDVTPAELVHAIITEKGIIRQPFQETLKMVVERGNAYAPVGS